MITYKAHRKLVPILIPFLISGPLLSPYQAHSHLRTFALAIPSGTFPACPVKPFP